MINPVTALSRLWNLLSIYKKEVYQIYFYALLNGLVNLSLPLGIQAIVIFIQTGQISTSWMILVLFVLLGIAITGFLQVMQLRIVEHIQQDIFARSAFEFAWRLPKIKLKELDQIHAPELVNRFFDTLTIQKGLPKILIDFSLAIFQIVFGLLLLAIYSPYFIILGVSLLALLFVIFRITGPKGLRTSLKESGEKYKLAHWLEEVARTNKSFKINSDSRLHMNKADAISHDYINARESHFKVLISQFRFIIGFKVLVAAGLLLLGGFLVFQGRMNLGQFVASEIVIILIINSVEKLLRIIDTIYDVLTSLEKIGYVTDLDLDEHNEVMIPDYEPGLSIQANNIEFAYKNQRIPLIDDLSFSIDAGSKVLLKGSGGSGKSTLLRLIAGMWEPHSGDILINEVSIAHACKTDLYPKIGFYLPTNQIFEGTIAENITMGRDIPEQKIYETIELLNLRSFLSQQPRGIDTLLDAEGKTLPRSIIQKLLIARAIIHEPELLLMEEPLVFIPENEKKAIAQYIMSPERPWTVVLIPEYTGWDQFANDSITLSKAS
ncbi:MAG: ABC transporter ATP-binding protein/permease [Saprospiraceae bacterium]|nr:ABC transporter ATP-binding protein/permease [Saprospiraceae bacterium]